MIIAVMIVIGILLLLFVVLRPGDKGGHYDDYFSGLNEELKKHGPGHPVMVLDLDRLDHNIRVLKDHIGDGSRYRVVEKSLPSVKLIRYIFEKTGTNKIMVFHRPHMKELPRAHMLLGKPMPINAVRLFYQNLKPNNDFQPQQQVQWLIDSLGSNRAQGG